ncbi:MAG TPA: selenoneine biosynthesis selenosugar synthase SenB [Roseateles sp.]|nr:selenoneine biosynthesis selenosugar synthase SenB [Roseateles sp.]
MTGDPIIIVSPALASSNNGNWRTAARWQKLLRPAARQPVLIQPSWSGTAASALIALHARRSAAAIAGFRAAHPDRPLALVLTGTDIYGAGPEDELVLHSLKCASHIVVLQPQALGGLADAERAKARVILQSAASLRHHDRARPGIDLVAVGHLRDEKDPLTLMRAARQLGDLAGLRIVHIGTALDPALGAEAERTMRVCPNYRWLGGLPQPAARRWIAWAHALVHMSRLEGGANVVIEALRSGTPVLASRIEGNTGLLGADYEGYFPPGDALALAQLVRRLAGPDPGLAQRLRDQCARREPLFTPQAEAAALHRLLADMRAFRPAAPA